MAYSEVFRLLCEHRCLLVRRLGEWQLAVLLAVSAAASCRVSEAKEGYLHFGVIRNDDKMTLRKVWQRRPALLGHSFPN